MPDPGDMVLLGSFLQERIGASTVGTLEVFELDDSDAGTSRRLECRGIVDLRGGRGRRVGKLRAGASGQEQRSGKAEPGKRFEQSHVVNGSLPRL